MMAAMSGASMSSRERVRAALEHRPVDRVPIDFGGHRSSGIMAIAYARLKEHLGTEPRVYYVAGHGQDLDY